MVDAVSEIADMIFGGEKDKKRAKWMIFNAKYTTFQYQ